MRVVATEVGYDNLGLRQVGDEFDMPDGSVARWFKPVEVQPVATPEAPAVVEAAPEAPAKRKYTKRI